MPWQRLHQWPVVCSTGAPSRAVLCNAIWQIECLLSSRGRFYQFRLRCGPGSDSRGQWLRCRRAPEYLSEALIFLLAAGDDEPTPVQAIVEAAHKDARFPKPLVEVHGLGALCEAEQPRSPDDRDPCLAQHVIEARHILCEVLLCRFKPGAIRKRAC